MKGIILAGGSGTHLYPITRYGKPMIYQSISVLMLAGLRDILIISVPEDLPSFQRLLGDCGRFGISLSYAEQPSADELAQAFLIGEGLIDGEGCTLVLGDNIYFGQRFGKKLENTTLNQMYLEQGKLNVEILGRDFAWLDTRTHNGLIDASQFIHTIEHRQGFKVACSRVSLPERLANPGTST
jgi:dTDP-glucose pyrophosphorylase